MAGTLKDPSPSAIPNWRSQPSRVKSPVSHNHCCLGQWERESRFSFYPLDEQGQEMSEYARVWKIYIDEATKADTTLIDGCNRNIDVLLVFTGLFSAVLTTFVVESHQMMIPSASDATNALLTQLIALQPNYNLTAPFKLPTDATTNPTSASSRIQWVNGLWFAALACSLSAALVSMLAKQWMQTLAPHFSGSHLFCARQRQVKHMQLQSWHVLALVNALPLLLHLALLLFFAGLTLLLWPFRAIAVSTFIVVGLVFVFYFCSMWLSMIDPDCPYQHPISSQLRSLFLEGRIVKTSSVRKDTDSPGNSKSKFMEAQNTQVVPEDAIDAEVLIWMMMSSNSYVVTAALQAMSALPKDFTATHKLRDAGALPLVLREFQGCFQKDSTLDLQWKVVDPVAAEQYCRAWMRLTNGTGETWDSSLNEPLQKLMRLPGYPDLNAVATCLWATSFLDVHWDQVELVLRLEDFAEGKSQITHATESWLIDTLAECSFNWELSIVQVEHIKKRAVPVLLQLLFLNQASMASDIRSDVGLALSSLTRGITSLSPFKNQEARRESYFEFIIPALSVILHEPARYGVKDELLDKTACELARLASPIFCQIERFKPGLKKIARHSLSKLYLDGRLKAQIVTDDILTDVLQMLYPPTSVSIGQHPLFVTTLLETLRASSNPAVVTSIVRLLDALLTDCPLPVIEVFIEEDGINLLLRTANTGDTDSRRLQLDCLRALFTFIKSTITVHIKDRSLREAPSKSPIDRLFQSNFFQAICSMVSSQRWWSPDIAEIWLPSLLNLCQTRPTDPVWPNVAAAFEKFANNNDGEHHASRVITDLEVIRGLHEGRMIVT